MTWEYRSTAMSSGTVTVPYSEYPPHVVASQVHQHAVLGQLLLVPGESRASARSSAGVRPRLRVPAMGRTVTTPSSRRTRTSGDEPTMLKPSSSRKYRYGDGLMVRSAR